MAAFVVPRAPYAPVFDQAVRAFGVTALVTEVIELLLAGQVALSIVFLVSGLLVGLGLGHQLARSVRDICEDAPVHGATELQPAITQRMQRIVLLGLFVLVVIVAVVSRRYEVATPIPALCIAAAIQAVLVARAIRYVERARGGQIVRPAGRLVFSDQHIRLMVNVAEADEVSAARSVSVPAPVVHPPDAE